MKRLLLTLMFPLTVGWAQSPTPPSFYNVIFVKTKTGKTSEYLEFAKKNASVVARAQIKAGKLGSLGHSQVFTPTAQPKNTTSW